jgi:hypothetical protein
MYPLRRFATPPYVRSFYIFFASHVFQTLRYEGYGDREASDLTPEGYGVEQH